MFGVAPLWLVPNVSCAPQHLSSQSPLTHFPPSCFGHPDSLDTPCRHWSATHTDILVGTHDEETLRGSYGIVPGATVRVSYHVNCISVQL